MNMDEFLDGMFFCGFPKRLLERTTYHIDHMNMVFLNSAVLFHELANADRVRFDECTVYHICYIRAAVFRSEPTFYAFSSCFFPYNSYNIDHIRMAVTFREPSFYVFSIYSIGYTPSGINHTHMVVLLHVSVFVNDFFAKRTF